MGEVIAWLVTGGWRIVAVAAVLVLAGAAGVYLDTGSFAADLGTTVSGARTLYQLQSNFASISNSAVYRYAPSSMQGGNSTLSTPWNGTVTFAPDANTSMFDVTVTNVPDSQCPGVAQGLGGVQQLTINSTVLTNAGQGIDAGSISNACNNASGDTLTFVLGK